jgi:hypothetical protein
MYAYSRLEGVIVLVDRGLVNWAAVRANHWSADVLAARLLVVQRAGVAVGEEDRWRRDT